MHVVNLFTIPVPTPEMVTKHPCWLYTYDCIEYIHRLEFLQDILTEFISVNLGMLYYINRTAMKLMHRREHAVIKY